MPVSGRGKRGHRKCECRASIHIVITIIVRPKKIIRQLRIRKENGKHKRIGYRKFAPYLYVNKHPKHVNKTKKTNL